MENTYPSIHHHKRSWWQRTWTPAKSLLATGLDCEDTPVHFALFTQHCLVHIGPHSASDWLLQLQQADTPFYLIIPVQLGNQDLSITSCLYVMLPFEVLAADAFKTYV